MSLYSKLYDLPSVNNLLGCLLLDPTLCLNDKYKLDLTDFYDPDIERGFQFQRLMYGAINNLATQGFKVVEYNNIGDYMIKWRPQYKILEENNYMDFCTTYKKLSSVENVQGYYNNVRKMSLLAEYVKNGYDISKFYNIDGDEDKERAKLESVEIDDIVNYFEGLQCDIRQSYCKRNNVEEYKAGTDFLDTVENIKRGCMIGDSFQSPYLNRIFNGMYGFILRSGGSGDGKSLSYVGDMMTLGCKQYWDENKKEFVDNKSFVGGVLMTNSELDLRNELELMLVAWISNIDRGKIRRWDLTKDEEERLLQSQKILEDSPIYLVDDPEFTIASLTETITKYCHTKNVKNVYFDYLNTNGYIDAELSQESSIRGRQDLILQTATDRLKYLQRSLRIGLLTGTQLNSKNQERDSSPNSTWLAGGQSQERKADGVMIMTLPTKKEIEAFNIYKDKKYKEGFRNKIECNRVTHIIKGRNSEFPKYIKVLSYLDTGTCRNTDLLVLTKDNMPLKIDKLIIERNEK